MLLHLFFAHAKISLERYSISTYVNTNAVDNTPGYCMMGHLFGGYLSVIRVGFRQYSNPYINSSSSLSLDNRLTLLDNQEAQIPGQILFFQTHFDSKQGRSFRIS